MNKHNYHIKHISSLGDDRAIWQTLCSSVFFRLVLSLHMPIMLSASHQDRVGKCRLINRWQANTQITPSLILKATMHGTSSQNCQKAGRKNIFQAKQLRGSNHCPNNYFLWIDHVLIEGSQTPNQNLQIINTHFANQHRPVQPDKESRCDGRAYKTLWQLACFSSLFQWKRERRRKEGWFHYHPTCRLMLHGSTQPTVVMVATCHVICVSPWMNGDLWDMRPPPPPLGIMHRGRSGSASALQAAGDTPTATCVFCLRVCVC